MYAQPAVQVLAAPMPASQLTADHVGRLMFISLDAAGQQLFKLNQLHDFGDGTVHVTLTRVLGCSNAVQATLMPTAQLSLLSEHTTAILQQSRVDY